MELATQTIELFTLMQVYLIPNTLKLPNTSLISLPRPQVVGPGTAPVSAASPVCPSENLGNHD